MAMLPFILVRISPSPSCARLAGATNYAGRANRRWNIYRRTNRRGNSLNLWRVSRRWNFHRRTNRGRIIVWDACRRWQNLGGPIDGGIIIGGLIDGGTLFSLPVDGGTSSTGHELWSFHRPTKIRWIVSWRACRRWQNLGAPRLLNIHRRAEYSAQGQQMVEYSSAGNRRQHFIGRANIL